MKSWWTWWPFIRDRIVRKQSISPVPDPTERDLLPVVVIDQDLGVRQFGLYLSCESVSALRPVVQLAGEPYSRLFGRVTPSS